MTEPLANGKFGHVARQADQHGLAGVGVDAGDGHRVGPQPPAPGAGVAADQQHVVATVVRAGHGVAGEHGEDEVALDADQVRAEEQRAGHRQAQHAVQPDHGPPVGQRQRQRLPDPPRVDEQAGPADREHHQAQAQVAQHGGVRARTRTRTGGASRPARRRPSTEHHEAAHSRVATRPTRRLPGDQLRRPGDDERHHHEHQGAPVAHTRGAVGGGGPVEQPGGRGGQPHGRVSLCWGSSPASITSHSGHRPARRAEAEGLGLPR